MPGNPPRPTDSDGICSITYSLGLFVFNQTNQIYVLRRRPDAKGPAQQYCGRTTGSTLMGQGILRGPPTRTASAPLPTPWACSCSIKLTRYDYYDGAPMPRGPGATILRLDYVHPAQLPSLMGGSMLALAKQGWRDHQTQVAKRVRENHGLDADARESSAPADSDGIRSITYTRTSIAATWAGIDIGPTI
jgi:hypothetical protein